jgi:hypothetical protein
MKKKIVLCLVAVVGFSIYFLMQADDAVPGATSSKHVQIINPGFEEEDAESDWESHEVKISDQAHSGKKALNITIPTLAKQKITIAPEDAGKKITVNFYAKGKGTLMLFFSHWKTVNGTEVATHGDWDTRQAFFDLGGEYVLCTYTTIIPPNTEFTNLNIGTNSEIDAYIDDVTVHIGDAAEKDKNPSGKDVNQNFETNKANK